MLPKQASADFFLTLKFLFLLQNSLFDQGERACLIQLLNTDTPIDDRSGSQFTSLLSGYFQLAQRDKG